jgi:hypothetical protein
MGRSKITIGIFTSLFVLCFNFETDAQTWSKTFSEIEVGSGGSTRIMVSETDELFIDEVQVMSPNQVMRIRKIDPIDGTEIASNTLELPFTTIYYTERGSSDLFDGGVVSAYTSSSAQGKSLIFRILTDELELAYENISLFPDSNVSYYQARAFSENEFLILGATNPAESSVRNLTLTKITSEGEVLWLKTLDGGSTPWVDFNIFARNIEISDSGHILVSALYFDEDTFSECSVLEYDYDRLIILCDPEGNEIWRYDGDEHCQYDNIPKSIFTSTNEIIVACGDYDPDFEPPFENAQGFYVPTLSKLSMEGEELWRIPIGEHGISASVFSVAETVEGDFIAVGTRFSLVGGQWEGFVAKVTTDGEILWNHNYRYAPDRPSFLFDVALLSDGRIACSGHAETSVGINTSQSWVLVLDQDGCLEADCGLSVDEYAQEAFNIYPNPVQNTLNLSWSKGLFSEAVITMRSLDGKILFEETVFISNQHQINTHDLPNGYYVLSVSSQYGVQTERVVVAHQ